MKQLLVFLVSMFIPLAAVAGKVDLEWTNATKNTDGSSIPASGPGSLVHTRVEYGTCNGNNFGTKQGEIVVAAPGNKVTVNDLVPQMFCFRAFHKNTYGNESASSNVVMKLVPAPTPMPPSTLTVSDLTAYTVIKRVDRFVMLPVGTVPAGTKCDPTQSVNGYYAVPRAAVKWSGDVQPDVVVAQCS
jgi:hypothetical protein